MITKSPSGALSPYYYKGGYFHGIHYGSYFDDTEALLSVIEKEEIFLLKSPEKRRILIDLYETDLTDTIIKKITEHIENISPRIIKMAITSDNKTLRLLQKALRKSTAIKEQLLYFCTDMEEGKTWLVSDEQ